MEDIYFAGVGSRETPEEIAIKQKKVAKILAAYGIILRSGGADGSDTNFEEAYIEVNGYSNIRNRTMKSFFYSLFFLEFLESSFQI